MAELQGCQKAGVELQLHEQHSLASRGTVLVSTTLQLPVQCKLSEYAVDLIHESAE